MTQTQNSQQFVMTQRNPAQGSYLPTPAHDVTVSKLTEDDRNEALAFLSKRSTHTVALAGFIRDNGILSAHNRGTFYGSRNRDGQLDGVALIGHATLVEARSAQAMRRFGQVAQTQTGTHMIMGQMEEVQRFWNDYAEDGQEIRRACRELLFEVRTPTEVVEEIEGLRPASLSDLDQIVPVQAAMAEAESGVNPLAIDPKGFRARCARRIEMGRTWVLEENGQLLFKADIQADTPEVIYLEGIWVAPTQRGKGIGRKCLTQLCRDLLARTTSVCLLVNEECERAHAFYRKCNFKLRGIYDSLFLCKA